MGTKKRECLGASALYVVLYLLIEPPTASPLLGGVPWVSLPGPTSVPSDTKAGWYRAVLPAVLMLRLTDVQPRSEKKSGKKE